MPNPESMERETIGLDYRQIAVKVVVPRALLCAHMVDFTVQLMNR